MSAVLKQAEYEVAEPDQLPVVVVGTGPVGIRFVEELLRRKPGTTVVIYGNEPWEPYNRVRLAGLLSGELSLSSLQNPIRIAVAHNVIQHHNCEILAIDRERREVRDVHGNSQRYSQLVLATGSRPHIPGIEGIDQSGIYTFRNLEDAEKLVARRARSRKAVVLGGGLLGLEAARGLQKYNTEVTVIEHAPRLMSQQLDDEAAALLREHMLTAGVQVVLGDSVKRVMGDGRIKAVQLRSGRRVACDTMVVATGIRPNISLALDAGIPVGRGIRVNDRMQTTDARVFAIGECAEHRDNVYGLVAPGLEQAGVAAHCIAGGDSHYTGSLAATRLKVVGVPVFSAGRSGEQDATSGLEALSWRSADNSCYRKLFLKRNRIVGIIAYGDWPETRRAQETLQLQRILWPWQRRRFLRYGRIWPEQEAASVLEWPSGAIVCQCTGVTRGALGQAMQAGHLSVDSLCSTTGASSVCGSCKPMLSELVGASETAPEPGSRTLTVAAILALLATLAVLFVPSVPFNPSAGAAFQWDLLWRDGLVKQITGFSLLGLALLLSALSLRKRSNRLKIGTFSGWRLFHVLVGVLAMAVLVAHTGLRLGHNLNLYLMLTFTGLLLAGALASGSIGLQHVLPRRLARQGRSLSVWTHILLIWPLPALLGFHVFKSYWF